MDISQNKRYIEIFKKLVEVYVETGHPVGSLMLSKMLDKPLSPATIRNVMADLEDLGILASDHVSSGRKPTDKGWRIFVDGLIESSNLSEIEKQTLSSIKSGITGQSLNSVLETAGDVLSKLSNCVSLIVTPTMDTAIRHIEFILLSPGRAIVVIISDGGQVENRLIEIPCNVSVSILNQISKYINTRFSGLTLEEIRLKVQEEMDCQKEGIDRIGKQIVANGLGFLSLDNSDRVIVRGHSNLVEQSNEIEVLNGLLKKFDEQQTIKQILEQSTNAQGVKIFIGAETKMFEMTGCSMIVSGYKNAKKNLIGALGVVGPSRLRYSRIIPLVDYTAKLLGSILSGN